MPTTRATRMRQQISEVFFVYNEQSFARLPLSISTTCCCVPSSFCASKLQVRAFLERPFPVSDGRRIPGYERLAGRARPSTGRHTQERLRRGRRRSVDLRVARRTRRQFESASPKIFPAPRSFAWKKTTAPRRPFSMPRPLWYATIPTGSAKRCRATSAREAALRFYEAQDSVSEAEFVCAEISTLSAQRSRLPDRRSLSHRLAVALVRGNSAPHEHSPSRGRRIQLLRARRSAQRARLRAPAFPSGGRRVASPRAERASARHRGRHNFASRRARKGN